MASDSLPIPPEPAEPTAAPKRKAKVLCMSADRAWLRPECTAEETGAKPCLDCWRLL
jgi:hypothetical protein